MHRPDFCQERPKRQTCNRAMRLTVTQSYCRRADQAIRHTPAAALARAKSTIGGAELQIPDAISKFAMRLLVNTVVVGSCWLPSSSSRESVATTN